MEVNDVRSIIIDSRREPYSLVHSSDAKPRKNASRMMCNSSLDAHFEKRASVGRFLLNAVVKFNSSGVILSHATLPYAFTRLHSLSRFRTASNMEEEDVITQAAKLCVPCMQEDKPCCIAALGSTLSTYVPTYTQLLCRSRELGLMAGPFPPIFLVCFNAENHVPLEDLNPQAHPRTASSHSFIPRSSFLPHTPPNLTSHHV